MIKLNLQMFAKSAAYQSDHRKSKAYASGTKIQEEIKKQEEKERESEKKKSPGEAVAAVNMRETYEIYRIENGKETPVMNNGAIVTRTGKQILEKMVYNKVRGVWQNSQKRTYRVRRIRK